MKRILLVMMMVVMSSFVVAEGQSDLERVDTTEAGTYWGWDTVKSFISIRRNFYGREMAITEKSQRNFNEAQPPTQLEWSLEREQIDQRNQRWNDPNKISYIYLFTGMGQMVGYFPIRGKVSSVNSKLTGTQSTIQTYDSSSTVTVESPSMDGSYGTNGDGIFFFLTDGTYMEWNDKYLLVDRPMAVNVKPVMSVDITGEL